MRTFKNHFYLLIFAVAVCSLMGSCRAHKGGCPSYGKAPQNQKEVNS
jgi:hypothetical protein